MVPYQMHIQCGKVIPFCPPILIASLTLLLGDQQIFIQAVDNEYVYCWEFIDDNTQRIGKYKYL